MPRLTGVSAIEFMRGIADLLDGFDFGRGDTLQFTKGQGQCWTASVNLTGVNPSDIYIEYEYEQHEVPDPDPRGYGDTAAVTASAMAHWSPDQTYTSTSERLTVSYMGDSILQTHISQASFETDYSLAYRIKHAVNLIQSNRDKLNEQAQDLANHDRVRNNMEAARAARRRRNRS